jgi:glucose/arabinose dehydrogenase/mono/diheme cytochrome c family protein
MKLNCNSSFFKKPVVYSAVSILSLALLSLTLMRNPGGLPPSDPNNGGITLPGGFEAVVVTDSIGPARHLAVNDNGDIYVKLRFSAKGGNVALRDTDNDGKADIIQHFGSYKDVGSLANGMRIHKGYLYYSSSLAIYRSKLTPGKLIPESEMETVLTDNHGHGAHWHITKPVSFDDKGFMYVPFGTPSNNCMDMANTPGGKPGQPGIFPCPELEQHAGIWRFDASKTGLTQKDGTLFATGLRSIVAMDWNKADKSLYVVQHGRDNLHRLFPELYTAWQSAVLPSEEFLKIKEGDDAGWPYYYYDQMQKKKLMTPEYGGDGKKEGKGKELAQPLIGFPGHWAPNDLYFYQGDQFPARYKNGAFIAFHGSTNRAPYPQAGYFVAFVPFKNGSPTGDWEVFADGFAGVDPIVNVKDAIYRPMGIAMGPDGSLYISETEKGKIWRVMYKGDKKNFSTAQLAEMEKHKLLSHIRTPDEVKDNLEKGKVTEKAKLYNTYCAACHQNDGKGDGNRFPPLGGTDWVTGDKTKLLNTVLKGLNGEIVVNDKPYNGQMPAHNFLKDEEVANILTYIRQNFGNNASAVSIEEVISYRNNQKK